MLIGETTTGPKSDTLAQREPGQGGGLYGGRCCEEYYVSNEIFPSFVQAEPPLRRWVTSVVELMFPGVAQRFRKCADWHQKTYGFGPLFGLFFNLCINTCFPGQRRVHCAPHADSKNIVGVCVLVIYQVGSE